jgi:RNA ligase
MTHYQFPTITHLSEILEAIEGREEFVVKVDEEHGYTVVNYLVNFEDTFPPVTDRRTALLRECRGITFDTATGKVLARKYHKFFNLGERNETLPENVDWSKPYRRFKKLDGSMITPLLIKGQVRFCTKMGLTGVAAPVDEWAKDRVEYHEFCKYWMSQGKTPIFEWCSRIQRIVIDYPVTQLVLTAIRDNTTGEYMDAPELKEEAAAYGIPCCSFSSLQDGLDEEMIEEIRAIEGEEGDVLRWPDGTMLKLKGEWYSLLHKTLEHLTHEKDVIRLIVDEKLDDAKPFLPEDLVKASDDFAKTIFTGLKKLASDIFWEVQAEFDNLNGSKKKFAEKVTKVNDGLQGFKFTAWDRLDEGEEGVYANIIKFVGSQLGSQSKVNAMRHLWGGASWSDYRDNSLSE